jgi:hypothetical protein
MFETTRSITDLVLAGVPRRHPGLRIIVPHAGAALPVLASRIDLFASALALSGTEVPSLREALNTLHFDPAALRQRLSVHAVAGMPVPRAAAGNLRAARRHGARRDVQSQRRGPVSSSRDAVTRDIRTAH